MWFVQCPRYINDYIFIWRERHLFMQHAYIICTLVTSWGGTWISLDAQTIRRMWRMWRRLMISNNRWNDVYNLYNQYVIHHMSCSRLLLEKQTASKCFWSICGKLWNYKYNTLPTWLECKGKMLYMLISGFLCWINMMFAFSQWRSQDLYLKYRRTNLPMFFLVCKLCVYRNCFGYCHRWNMLLPFVQLLQTACR